MKCSGWGIRQTMAGLAVVICILSTQASALEEVEEREPCYPCPQAPDSFLVDSSDLARPDFSTTFALYLNWDYSNASGSEWTIDDLQDFVDFVMPENDPDDSIAHRTAFYFGHDTASPYDSIVFPQPGGAGQPPVYNQFDITLRYNSEEAKSCSGSNCVALTFSNWATPIEQLARDNFAHEFAHLAYNSIHGGAGCNNSGTGFREFPPMSSEYYNGYIDSTLQHDSRYLISLSGQDWEDIHNGLAAQNRRDIFRPFTLYLQEHYRNPTDERDDLLYRWFQSEECGNEWQLGPHDWDNLAYQCGQSIFSSYFDNEGGDARLRELFQEFALAMWVNDDGIADLGDDAVYHPTDENRLPQDYRFFSGANYGPDGYSLWEYDDARTIPLYNTVSASKSVKRDRISYMDLYDLPPFEFHLCVQEDSTPVIPSKSRPIAFETYGMYILPFVTNAAIDADPEGYNLHVSFVLQDSLYTGCGEDGWDDPEFTTTGTNWDDENDVLHFWILGYPEDLKEELDYEGAAAVLIGERTYTPPLSVDQEIELVIPNFGREYESVVIIATLTEETASDSTIDVNTIPFLYKWWADKDFTVSGETDFVYIDEFCVPGEISIPDSVSLEFDEDTEFLFAEYDPTPFDQSRVGFQIYGELTITGDTETSISLSPMVADEDWTGFTIESGGELHLDYVTIDGIDRIDCKIGTSEVSIQHADIAMANDATGFDLREATTSLLSYVDIDDATALLFKDTDVNNSDISVAQYYYGSTVLFEANGSMDEVRIYDAYTAITCEDSASVTLDDVSASGLDAGCAPKFSRGLVVSQNAIATITNCSFTNFCNAIRIEDNGFATLRSSALDSTKYMGVYLHSGSGPDADLGKTFTHGNNCIAMIDTTFYRVYNRNTTKSVDAIGNFWGDSVVNSSIFYGLVDWSSHLSSCPDSSGGPQLAVIPHLPKALSPLELSDAYPNPFNPETLISFQLPDDGSAFKLAIYDVSGRRVALLSEGTSNGSEYSVVWNGRDDHGSGVSAGVYFVRLQAGADLKTSKLVLVK